MKIRALTAIKYGGRRYEAGDGLDCDEKWAEYLIKMESAEAVDEAGSKPTLSIKDLTKDQIIEQLEAKGIEFNEKSKKAELFSLLMEHRGAGGGNV